MSETEQKSLSQFLAGQTEGKIYHDAKEIFDSAYVLSKKTNNQFRHLMFCLKVTNNVAINHCSYQSLYDFIQLSLINTTKRTNTIVKKKHALKSFLFLLKRRGYFWIAKDI